MRGGDVVMPIGPQTVVILTKKFWEVFRWEPSLFFWYSFNHSEDWSIMIPVLASRSNLGLIRFVVFPPSCCSMLPSSKSWSWTRPWTQMWNLRIFLANIWQDSKKQDWREKGICDQIYLAFLSGCDFFIASSCLNWSPGRGKKNCPLLGQQTKMEKLIYSREF